jgi:hypothetical protein
MINVHALRFLFLHKLFYFTAFSVY